MTRRARRVLSLAAVILVWSLGCQDRATVQPDGLPDSIELSVESAGDVDGFLVLRGRTNLPAGLRLLVVAHAAPAAGSELVESALVPVGPDGRFEHRTLLSYPVQYALAVEFSAAGNPERAELFDASLKERAAVGTQAVEEPGARWKLVARTTCRLGSPQEERDLLTAHLQSLGDRVKRLELDRVQIGRALAGRDAWSASSAYIAWARIRAEKVRELGLDTPGLEPFYRGLDTATRALWRRLDLAALALLARAVGDADEIRRLESAVERFDRDLERAKAELEDRRARLP